MKREVHRLLALTMAVILSLSAFDSSAATKKDSKEESPKVTATQGKNAANNGAAKKASPANPAAKKPAAKKPVKVVEEKELSKFAENFRWGFHNGAIFSHMAVDTKVRVSYVAGIFGELAINDKWAFVAEAQYSDQGAQVYVLKDDGVTKYRHFNSLKYVNVPLMFQYNIYKRFNIKFGIQGEYLVSAKYKWRNMTRFESWIIEEGYNSFDVGIPVALSYNFPSGIFFEGRFAYGLTVITCETSNPLDIMPDYRNRASTLTIGYKF